MSSPASLVAEASSLGALFPWVVFGVIGAILVLFVVIGRSKKVPGPLNPFHFPFFRTSSGPVQSGHLGGLAR